MKSSHNLKLLDNITRKINPHPTREKDEEKNEIPSFLGYETCYSVEMNGRKKAGSLENVRTDTAIVKS